MAFIQLKEFRAVEVVEKKERISLIVKCSMDSHILFFRDCTYQHVDRTTQNVLHEGRLEFLPTRHLQSARTGRVVVLGTGGGGELQSAAIDLERECAVQVRQVENTSPESTTAYHLYEPLPSQEGEEEAQLFIIRIEENIENGIAVAVFDFWRGKWCEQMIALSSKFLNYRLLPTHNCAHLYREPADLSCHSFALVASGERFDSVNYSKIKFCHQMEGGERVLRIKFVITRELRLKKQMTIIAGHQIDHARLLIIGNARRDSNNPQEARNTPAFVVLNTAAVENNEPQELSIVSVDFGREVGKSSLQIRSFLGVLGEELIVMLLMPFGKVGFGKMGLHAQEIFFEGEIRSGNAPFAYQLSANRDCFYRYELDCEPFFEKIKKAPSKITYHLVKIYDKREQYSHLIRNAFPLLDSFFIKEVLSLL